MSVCAAFAGVTLLHCLSRDPACLRPEDAPLRPWLAAISEQESSFRPFAIRDETAGESLFPATRAEAERIARERHAQGHTLGLGLFHLPELGRHGPGPVLKPRVGRANLTVDVHLVKICGAHTHRIRLFFHFKDQSAFGKHGDAGLRKGNLIARFLGIGAELSPSGKVETMC